jgi:endonuclease/exonuclease/phosphatase family metal-dependent hydrolase
MGFLGLGFPVLLAGMLLLLLVWLLLQRRVAGILLLIILCGSYHFIHLFGWHANRYTAQKTPGTIRVMGWNVENFTNNQVYQNHPGGPDTYPLFKYIHSQQPDIICMQDFCENANPQFPSQIRMLQQMGYRYYAFAKDYWEYPFWGPNYAGTAIFSRYPLAHVQRIPYGGKKMPNSVILSDVTVNGITRRLVATHLQSMHLRNLPPSEKGAWVQDEDSAINYSGSVLKKMDYYLPYHAQQARLVRRIINESPYPVIFSADMNEVPTSFCYHTIKGNLADAFLERGSGLGQTYSKISPTLRIDYLLVSPGTEVVQFKKDGAVNLSDHYPLLMDIRW